MMNLTFGEQVKVILGRKGMTIKELAEKVEEYTGKPMSRQNMTQRLGRDNFQEQDMRMIAEILDCQFTLSIMESYEEKKEEVVIQEVERNIPTMSKEKPVERIEGEINPYTLKEYASDSVRIHPNRIGYVQVYDRARHSWIDMTEWAFLGEQERKKVELGKDYKPPVYLD